MPFSYEDEYGRKYFRKLFFKKTLGEREAVILEEGDIALDEDGKIYFGDGTTTGGTELVTGSSGSSITLSSFSVTTAAAGTAALSYNNTSGVFTYTPPDLSSYQTSSGLNTAIDGHLNVSGASNNQVLSWNGSDYAWVNNSGGSGIALTDLSVGAEGSASGDGAIAYNNTTGVFTYTPPDLSSYLTSVPAQTFASLTGKPTTIAGYGITDAFDGDYNNLTNTPTIPAAYTNSDVDAHLNQSNPTSGYVLSWNGSDYAWVVNGTGTGLGDVVDDTTPQLGGTLDANGNDIDMGTNVLTDTNLGQFITAYGWGDHSTAGYQTSSGLNASIDSHLNQSNPTSGYVLSWDGSDYAWVSNGTASEVNDLSASVTWADVPDANITESSVTQHQAALSITESQISDLGTYLTAETNDLSSSVTWANVPDTNITESSVTQHQAALSITESQISDLGTYLTAETDTLATVTGRGATTTTTAVIPFYYANQSAFPNATTYHGAIAHSHSDGAMYFAHSGSWNKLANDSQLTNSSNWDTAYGWGDHSTEGYLTSYSVTESDVTAHQAALSITESQISDLGTYLTSVAFSDLTSTPTTLSGYGITDGYANSDVDAHLNQSNPTDGYVLSWTSGDYAWVANGSGSSIALTDLSVTTASAGTAALSYDNSSGVFTYTPPDLSGYMQSGTALGTLTATSIEAEAVTADSTDGNDFTMTGGDASGLNSTGGDAVITGGSGALNSGDVTIGATQTEEVNIGASGVDIRMDGPTQFNENATFESGTFEAFSTITGATGTVTHDCDNGHIFYHTSPSANFTANFTNLGLSTNYATGITIVIDQGATARIPSAVQTDGTSRTIVWQGGSAPSGTNNGVDVVSFSILRTSGSYVVLGQLVDFA